jgi:hypothetical protein
VAEGSAVALGSAVAVGGTVVLVAGGSVGSTVGVAGCGVRRLQPASVHSKTTSINQPETRLGRVMVSSVSEYEAGQQYGIIV